MTAEGAAADQTLGELREAFRTANGVPETATAFEWIRLGPLPIPIPNPPSRRRAIRIHDLHHLVTGFSTDLAGEAQVSAWECAAGLHNEPVAWIFCPVGTLGGMLRWPRRTAAAYAWGRASRSLFGQHPQVADALPISEAEGWCRTIGPRPAPSVRDWLGAMQWAAFGLVAALLPPVALLVGWTRSAPLSLS